MDRAPLVDFCNQHDPRAHPQDRPNPVSRVALPRRFTLSCPLARARQGALLREEAGAPSRAMTATSRGFTGQGPACFRRRRVSRWLFRAAASALPQPDPLGHLSSWNRGNVGWRPRRCLVPLPSGRDAVTIPPHERYPPRRVSVREPPTIRRLGARLHRPHAQGRIGDRGPHHPFFREEDRDPPRPRCLPSVSMLDRDEPYLCSGMVLSTVCCQPVDNIRRLLQSRWDRRP